MVEATRFSTGFFWIVSLITIAVSGLLFMIFNYAFSENAWPAMMNQMNSSVTNQTLINTANSDVNLGIWIVAIVPIVLISSILLGLLLNSLTKDNRGD